MGAAAFGCIRGPSSGGGTAGKTEIPDDTSKIESVLEMLISECTSMALNQWVSDGRRPSALE